jgi:hypothetical protein
VATTSATTVTEILEEVVEPTEPAFASEFARMLLQLRLSDAAQERIRDFLRRHNAGALNAADKEALKNYLLVGQLLDLLQAKARVSLQGRPASP